MIFYSFASGYLVNQGNGLLLFFSTYLRENIIKKSRNSAKINKTWYFFYIEYFLNKHLGTFTKY